MFSFFKSSRQQSFVTVEERRAEERISTQGEVILILESPQMLEVRGRLLDKSASGFRASHMYPALTSGQLIRCRLEGAEVLVRVVWNRIIEEEVESGFLIL